MSEPRTKPKGNCEDLAGTVTWIKMVCTVNYLNIGTDRSEQIVQTQF